MVFKWRDSAIGLPSFCVEIATDRQRDRILREPNFYCQRCDATRAAGFPSDLVPRIRFRVESRETLDRDYGGSWWEAVEKP
jgi:hypothetical protein